MGRTYQFKTGALQCSAVSDGHHEYESSSFFVGIPDEVVRDELAALGQTNGKVTTPYTFLLVRTGSHRVLVDVGAGSLMPTTGMLVESLDAAGVPAESIDTVVITHAHPDAWIELARTVLKAAESRLTLVDDDTEFLPGVRMIPTPGHTPGHAAIVFHSDGQTLVLAADTALFPLHLRHPDWKNQFDWDPQIADESRRAFCEQAVREEWLLMFQHFPPFPSVGRIEPEDGGWSWIPVE